MINSGDGDVAVEGMYEINGILMGDRNPLQYRGKSKRKISEELLIGYKKFKRWAGKSAMLYKQSFSGHQPQIMT
jgi:hypothetical protein